MRNALYYGDNLSVLREHIPDESVDLVYLDPPFNSNASYNVLFKEKTGEESPAQIKAFTDTWEWTQETERAFEQDIILNPSSPAAVKDMITALRQFVGRNALMAYLVMMTPPPGGAASCDEANRKPLPPLRPYGEPLFEAAHRRRIWRQEQPVDVGSARALWEDNPYEFEHWATALLEAYPQERKKGADRGIDGLVYFVDGPRRTPHKAVIQVKGGHVSSPQIRDLKGVVEREKAALGLFITLAESTREMRVEAASSGFFHSDIWDRDYPKIQIRTVQELLGGSQFEIPARPPMYQAAQRVRRSEGRQATLDEAVTG